MSDRAKRTIMKVLCGSPISCPDHEAEAAQLYDAIVADQKLDREDEAQKALDRLVGDVIKHGTHAV